MKKTSHRNIVLAVFFSLIIIYILFHIAGGKFFNRSSGEQALEAREALQQEVEQERVRQESEELDQMLTDLDQTDLGALPQ